MKTPKKHINTYLISLLTFITSRFQNRKLKLNSRAIRALELLEILQNHQKIKQDFMKKSRSPKTEEICTTYKSYLKPLKRAQRTNITQKNCKSLELMQKKHGLLRTRYLESAPQNPQLFN